MDCRLHVFWLSYLPVFLHLLAQPRGIPVTAKRNERPPWFETTPPDPIGVLGKSQDAGSSYPQTAMTGFCRRLNIDRVFPVDFLQWGPTREPVPGSIVTR